MGYWHWPRVEVAVNALVSLKKPGFSRARGSRKNFAQSAQVAHNLPLPNRWRSRSNSALSIARALAEWDMDNEQGHAEAFKEVVHKASLRVGESTKAPNYSFRTGGTPKFYLESR